MSFARLVAERKILVVVGSGGVGKTTTAATLALLGARACRRTLVCTIDPARRLANSLGIEGLGHEPQEIPVEKIWRGEPPDADCRGSLHAMMLDQKRTFDEIVEQYAPDAAQVERIKRNRIYQQISGTLTGSHEYAAMAKLYDLARPRPGQPVYDLIVLDTPPTANALDFLDAPQKLVGAIDSPALQWFLKPYLEGGGSFSRQLVGFWGASVIKRLAKFVGSRFLEDMAQFIGEFNTVLGAFRQRASDVMQLLHEEKVAFIVVSAPAPLTIDEALYFARRLRDNRMPLGGFIVNRVHPRGPTAPERQTLVDTLAVRHELRGMAGDDVVQVAADLGRTYGEFQALAEIDQRQVTRLDEVAAGTERALVPLFDRDIYDVDGLTLVGNYLAP